MLIFLKLFIECNWLEFLVHGLCIVSVNSIDIINILFYNSFLATF